MKLSAGELARLVAPHLLAFAFPCYALFFLLTGPHFGWSTLLYVLPLLIHASAWFAGSTPTTRARFGSRTAGPPGVACR